MVLKKTKTPFYKITIELKNIEQKESRQAISVVREYRETDLDRIWHMLNVKCEEKWGRKLNSFDCVRISKRSPEYLKYIQGMQRKLYDKYDDLLSTEYMIQPMSSPAENRPQAVNGKYRNHKK